MASDTRAILLSLIVIVGFVGVFAGSTIAQPPGKGNGHGTTAIVVDDDLQCPDADHETIQAGVDAADSGDTVKVCDGTYREQVNITTALTLEAADGATPVIEVPDDPGQFTIPESGPAFEPIVFAYGGTSSGGAVSGTEVIEVDISGFVIDGRDRQPDAKRSVGILYRNADGDIEGNTVEGMAIGGKETMGILVYGDSEVDIVDNVVDGYERGGIGANGDGGAHPAPIVTIKDNFVNGSVGIGEAWGPNGIQVGFGAEGNIVYNVVKNNRYSATDPIASGILVFESDNVQIRGNVVENADAGIAVGSWGWFRQSADNTKITRNTVSEANVGIALRAVAYSGFSTANASVSNTKVIKNEIRDSGDEDYDIGIQVTGIDASPNYNSTVANNKLINNDISGFNVSISDDGSGTKLAANEP